MPYDNWFIGVEYLKEAGGTAENHLDHVRTGRPGSFSRFFDLAGGRRFSALCADAAGAVENQRYWLWVLGPRQPEASLKQALASGRTFDELRRICTSADAGDSAFVVIDKDAGRIYAITDRLNVSKIFHGRIGGGHAIASKVSLFPRQGLTPDPGAIASFVLNGSCLNNRTLFRGIASLERASSHEFSGGAHSMAAYWHYRPGQEAAGGRWRPDDAAMALWELLVRSVDRVARGKQVLLALSGGYDSGALLGILGSRLKHPDVVCFSYVYGSPKSGSDADVAARQAALYGYRHVAVGSYASDFLGMLDRNAAIGEGLRGPSYEIEAFPALAERLTSSAQQVMLFGDECLGWGSYRLRDADDLLGSINLKASAFLGVFESITGKDAADRLRVGLEADYDQLRRKVQGFADPDDGKDFLYLDQRVQFSLLPLRRFIAGHWFPLALPLISPEILDFMATVPVAYRLDKRLFKIMGRRFLPSLFRIPRATRGQLHPDFDREIASTSDVLERAIAERDWKINGLFGNEALIALLREFRAKMEKMPRPGSAGTVKRRLKKAVKTMLANSRFLEERQQLLRRLTYNEFTQAPGRELLLMNLLCAADFLATAPAAPDVHAQAGAHQDSAG